MDNNRAAWRGLFYTANFSAQYETKTFNLNLRISTLSLSLTIDESLYLFKL